MSRDVAAELFPRAEQGVGHRGAEPVLEPVPAPAAAVDQSLGDVRGAQRPQDVGGALRVQAVSEPEALGDVPGESDGGPLDTKMSTALTEVKDLCVRSIHIMADGSLEDFEAVVHPDARNREGIDEPPASRGRGPAAFYATGLWLRDAYADLA